MLPADSEFASLQVLRPEEYTLAGEKRAEPAFRAEGFRSASFNNVTITPWIMRGVYVPDIVTILGSLYFILGDIDR